MLHNKGEGGGKTKYSLATARKDKDKKRRSGQKGTAASEEESARGSNH